MVVFNWKKLILTYLLVVAVDVGISMLLSGMGIDAIYIKIADSYVLALLLNIINYPKELRKYCLKDKYFHRNVAISFLLFFVFNLFIF